MGTEGRKSNPAEEIAPTDTLYEFSKLPDPKPDTTIHCLLICTRLAFHSISRLQGRRCQRFIDRGCS